jgi:hypothetical protein
MGSKPSRERKSIRRLLRQAEIHEEIDEKTTLLVRNYQTFLMLIADISSGGPRRAVYDLRIFTDDELARLQEVGKTYFHLIQKNWLRPEPGL